VKAETQSQACPRSSAVSGSVSAQTAEVKLAGQTANQGVFGLFHLPTCPGVQVIVTEQVQYPVNDIADQLTLPGGVELVGLGYRLVEANKDFPVQQGKTVFSPVQSRHDSGACNGKERRLSCSFGVVKGDNIRRASVLQESPVEAGHLGRGYKIDGQIEAAIVPAFLKQRLHDLTQKAQVHPVKAMVIPQRQRPLSNVARLAAMAGFPLPSDLVTSRRCSHLT
jgi:hypothetical protein